MDYEKEIQELKAAIELQNAKITFLEKKIEKLKPEILNSKQSPIKDRGQTV